jgi:uncharacterized membrane protein required for colicin V production
MTWLDWVVIAMFVYFTVQGLIKGVAAALLGAVTAALAYVLAAIILPSLGDRLAEATPLPAEWDRLILFVFMFLVFYLLGMLIISTLPGGKRPSLPAQLAGVAAGAVKALVVAMSVVGILLASPLSDAITQDVDRSSVVRYVAAMQKQYIQEVRRISPVPFPPVGPDAKF